MVVQNDTNPALEVRRLRKQFPGGRGVDDVSLTVSSGSITAFIGANGAGKSTTLRCALGLMRPDSGEVRLFGRPADRASLRAVGFLPEERGLFPRDRARDTVAFHARLKGLGRASAFQAADEILARVGLGTRARDRIETLSKGNAQRVQLLCAMAHQPRLLVLDEPFSGLDPIAQSDVLTLFAEFKRGGGSILFSTHSMATAENVCDRVVMLEAGRTVFEGPLEEVSRKAPHGAIVVTPDQEALLMAARSIGGDARPVASNIRYKEGEPRRWQIALPEGVTHPVLMRALAEHHVSILAFNLIKADLEGAFWGLSHGADETSSGELRRKAA